tara:strand:+ start:717 stop:1070 length:354 start_codon:yes stop_codon:yes gene_type:complete
MINKYTKEEIYNKLGISHTWSDNKKRKFITDTFRRWNARSIVRNDEESLKEAKEMMEYCAAAMLLHKPKPHKRNYKKTITKKKRKTTKKKTKKSGDGEGYGGWFALFILFLLLISGC